MAAVTDRNDKVGGWAGETSSTLLARVRARDEEAWRRFVSLYTPLVSLWCRQHGLQDADAADVGQEVFRVVAAKIDAFRHGSEGDSLRGWLRAITRNKCRDLYRRRSDVLQGTGGSDAQAHLLAVPDEAASDSADPPSSDEERVLLRRAVELVLDDFQEQTRRAFLAVVLERRDPTDVASELGMTANAVYLAKSRILRRLREEFGGLMDL